MSQVELNSDDYKKILQFLFEVMNVDCSNSIQHILSLLNSFFGFECSSFWTVDNENLSMHNPIGVGIDQNILSDYEKYYQKYDEYNLQNFDPKQLQNLNLMEFVDEKRKNRSSPYMQMMNDINLSHRYGLILRNNDNSISGAIAIFEPLGGKKAYSLSPRYLEVVAPFITREYLNTKTLNYSEQIASIMHTALNTSQIGVAAFSFHNPNEILFYNSACTKYCYDFFPKSTLNKAIISEFIKQLIPYNQYLSGLNELTIELKAPTGNVYSVRVVNEQQKVGNGVLVISPKSLVDSNISGYPNDLFSLLSPREKDVLLLIAKGKTNSEIAKALFISESTVKGHVQHIFEKAKVSNRTSLLAIMSIKDK